MPEVVATYRVGPRLATVWHHLLRWRWAVLSAWFGFWAVPQLGDSGGDWQYFVRGARSIFSSVGLHTYARDPGLQIGPPALVFAAPLCLLGAPTLGKIVAEIAMILAGMYALWRLEHAAVGPKARGKMTASTTLIAGLLLAPVWVDVAVGTAHLDDVLVTIAAAAAIVACASERYYSTALFIGLAVAAKPWAVGVLPLVLAAPPGLRKRLVAVSLAVPMACWLPFVVGDAHTAARLSSIHLGIASDSPLAVLGLTGTAPSWVRPAQFAAGILCGALAVKRGRWAAVPLVAFSARILLEPQTVSYYTASILLAAIMWDLIAARRQFPIWTIITYLSLYEANYLMPGSPFRGVVRAAFCLSVLGAMCLRQPRQAVATDWAPDDLHSLDEGVVRPVFTVSAQ